MPTLPLSAGEKKLIAECRSRFYPFMEAIILPFLAVVIVLGSFSLLTMFITQLRREEQINVELLVAGFFSLTLLILTVHRFWRLRQLRLLVDKLARFAEQNGTD